MKSPARGCPGLDEAVAPSKQLVTARGIRNVDPIVAGNLAAMVMKRFDRCGSTAELDLAVVLAGMAVGAPPFLAFLSACSTGAGDTARLADGAVHLVNALQLAGFRHVVGVVDAHWVAIITTITTMTQINAQAPPSKSKDRTHGSLVFVVGSGDT
ncbi:hypothetical protein CDD83_61 [Cordyceps sp. RAO-2017]|nr:hypothetical protein CDD83_61 [Cordyceps sp. RAO-2017]